MYLYDMCIYMNIHLLKYIYIHVTYTHFDGYIFTYIYMYIGSTIFEISQPRANDIEEAMRIFYRNLHLRKGMTEDSMLDETIKIDYEKVLIYFLNLFYYHNICLILHLYPFLEPM
jgi:hypothetical protein